MKKTLLIALAAVLCYGCSKKNNSSPSASISGKWYVTTDSVAQYANGAITNHYKDVLNHTAFATFNSNGTGESVSTTSGVTDTIQYKYTVSGKQLTLNFPTQTVDGETIEAYSEQFTINILTSSKLETEQNSTEVDDGVTYRFFELTDFDR